MAAARATTPPSHASMPTSETSVPAAEAAVPSAEVSSAMPTANEDWSFSTDPEYRRREKSAVQGIQRRNLLIVGLGGILCGVTLLPLRHLIAVVIALVAFVNAYANVGIVIPVNRAGLCRVLANLVRRQVFHKPALIVGFNFDLRESRV